MSANLEHRLLRTAAICHLFLMTLGFSHVVLRARRSTGGGTNDHRIKTRPSRSIVQQALGLRYSELPYHS